MTDYLKIYILTTLAILVIFVGVGHHQGQIVGDLTRLGNFSERDFGSSVNRSEPMVRPEKKSPSVIVLGDSFSDHNYWQPLVAEAAPSLAMNTIHWRALAYPDCVLGWIRISKQANPHLRVVVIQSVERNFVFRFGNLMAECTSQKVKSPHKVVEDEHTLTARIRGIFPDPVYTLLAVRNGWRSFDVIESSGTVGVVPLSRDDLFSNRRSNRLLYFKGDEVKLEWQQAQLSIAAKNLRMLQDASDALGVKVLVAIIPDKSTAYRPYMVADPFGRFALDVWFELDRAGVRQLNVKSRISKYVGGIPDLYLPNDTHFGEGGYRLFAEQVRVGLIELLASKGP